MKISIITPSFRQLDWLQLCIASIADQQNVEVEHIVQDAGSAGFSEFAERMRKAWPDRPNYARKMITEADEGMYDAINRGLRKAEGEILAYLNCDEQYLPGTLARVGRWFQDHPGQDVVFGDAIVVDAQGGYLCSRRALVPQVSHTQISGNLSIFTSSTFFRKRVRDRGFLFEKSWKVAGDAVWAIRLRREGVPCRSWDNPLAVFTETGQNLSLLETARKEQEFLRQAAPPWVRLLAPWLVAWYRWRRWWAGAYRRRLVSYSIYTLCSPRHRKSFGPIASLARWPGRS